MILIKMTFEYMPLFLHWTQCIRKHWIIKNVLGLS